MLYSIDCKTDIATQDETYPTYIGIDCDLHTNANDDNFYGRLIDCDLSITVVLVTACKSWEQAIRTIVTIDAVPVTDALVGAINIQHNKNMISTFSLNLNNTTYSPLTNSHIAPNKVVIITSYLDGNEQKLFTGLIDDISTDYSLDGFQININGSDYGKKLRNKRTSLISVQDSADTKYRGSLVKYMAEQAGVTDVDAPQGSYTRIDHSFEDQYIIDMITKELTIDTYWWRFDENGTLKIALDEIKTSTGTYPTPDWTYGEDRFLRLGLSNTDGEIINTLKILGTVYQTQILVPDEDSGEDSPFSEYVYSKVLFSDSQSFADDEDPASHTKTVGDFTLGIKSYPIRIEGLVSYEWIRIIIGCDDQLTFDSYNITSVDYEFNNYKALTEIATIGQLYVGGNYYYGIKFKMYRKVESGISQSFDYNISLNGYFYDEMEMEAPAQSDETSPTYEYHYDQVGADITDSSSITRYGERKANTESTIDFPLAENVDQCLVIGRKIIRDSHRFMRQPDFEIPFNPKLIVGQTIGITDKKIGYSERWYVEEVNHTIEQGKGRTRVGCVYYA